MLCELRELRVRFLLRPPAAPQPPRAGAPATLLARYLLKVSRRKRTPPLASPAHPLRKGSSAEDGTHVSFAPCWEFFAKSYLPQLRAMGARVEAEIESIGFYPAGGGRIRLRVEPVRAEDILPLSLEERGALRSARVTAVVSGIPVDIAESEAKILCEKFPDLALERDVREVDSPGPGNAVWVTLEYERVTAVFSEVVSYDLSRKVVAHRVMNAVRKYLKTGAPVGPHLADQLAVPIIALTGAGTFVKGKDTLHETTNWETIRAFLPEAASNARNPKATQRSGSAYDANANPDCPSCLTVRPSTESTWQNSQVAKLCHTQSLASGGRDVLESLHHTPQPPETHMSELNLSNDVLKNLLGLVTQGVAKDKLGGAADLVGSLLGGSSGGGLAGLASLAGGLLGGAKGGANDLLDKLASAVKTVLGSGSLAAQTKDVFKSRLLDGNSVAAVAKQFGIAEGSVDGLVNQGVAAIRDQFLKLV